MGCMCRGMPRRFFDGLSHEGLGFLGLVCQCVRLDTTGWPGKTVDCPTQLLGNMGRLFCWFGWCGDEGAGQGVIALPIEFNDVLITHVFFDPRLKPMLIAIWI